MGRTTGEQVGPATSRYGPPRGERDLAAFAEADEPDLCDFTLPSIGRRGSITVAVSTNGLAPALARHLRQRLVDEISLHHVQLARLSGWLRGRLPRGAGRSRLLRLLVEEDIGGLLVKGQRRAAWARLRAELEALGETT